MNETKFCISCGEVRSYRIKSRIGRGAHNNVRYGYLERIAVCDTCGIELYIPHVNDMNVEAAERAYKLAKEKEKK